MLEYRLFMIKEENIKPYQKKPELLFDILKTLFSDKENMELNLSLYQQLCLPFQVELLCDYIYDRVPSIKLSKNKYKILSFYEKTSIYLYPSHIFIKTDECFTQILKTFHIYHKNIFVVDFKNRNYFWLDEYIRKHFYIKDI